MLIEFCSDFVVAQELPADGVSLLLVLIISGGLGGAKPLRGGCFSIHRGQILGTRRSFQCR